MRPICAAALLTAALALTATACGGSASPAAEAATTASVHSASPTPDHDADVCKGLAVMKFDASTQDAIAATQGQVDALLKLQPSYAPLGMDVMASGNALVTVDTDLADVQSGTAGAAQQYQADVSKLKDALLALAKDCQTYAVPFTVHLASAS